MIDLIGRLINDTTKFIMGTPNTSLNMRLQPQKTPCINCGQNTLTNQQNNGIVFNAEKSNTSALRRINPELEVNLRDTPYTNTTGLKFN